jgi:membrane fusion protein, copper/silver efflux system
VRTTEFRRSRRRLVTAVAALTFGVGLAGCQASKSGEPVRVGDYLVSARAVPDPPTTGDNRLVLELKDAQGVPVEGASLDFLVSMPAMGAMPPMRSGGQTRARGGGVYELTYSLAMVGDWTIVLRLTAAGHPSTELRFSVSPPRKGVVLQAHGGSDGELPAATVSTDAGVGRLMDVSTSRQQLIGVTWGRTEKRALTLTLRLPGKVDIDETQVADVTLRYPAFVEKLYVSKTGQSVRQGEPLLTLYSPELLAAEQDYLVAKGGGETGLIGAAEERLKLWGVSGEQLRALNARGTAEPRVTLRAPLSGVVLTKNVVEGTRAETGMALYRVGNLGRIWVLADVFQTDASVVAVGQQATMSVPGLPGATWAGRVSFIYPTVDERTRSLRLRLEFGNSEARLRPGMYSDVSVQVPLGELLVIPDSALLRSGEHAYVFVRRGTGGLQPVEVEPGVSNGEFTEVRAGLAPGDEVATAAAFLLSSEAQLRDALPRWRTP